MKQVLQSVPLKKLILRRSIVTLASFLLWLLLPLLEQLRNDFVMDVCMNQFQVDSPLDLEVSLEECGSGRFPLVTAGFGCGKSSLSHGRLN